MGLHFLDGSDDQRGGVARWRDRARRILANDAKDTGIFEWMAALGFALVFGGGLFAQLGKLGRGDWDYFVSHVEAGYRSVVLYGQLPLWTPYHCGGRPLFENFQSRVYSPSFLAVLALGSNLGTRVVMAAALALGYEGTRRFAARHGAGRWSSHFAALAATGNGAVLAQSAAGHFGSMPYLFWPWWFMAIEDAERKPGRAALCGGAWLALSFLEAGMYPLVHGAILAGGWCALSASYRRTWAPLRALALVGCAGLSLCAFVLLPSLVHLAKFPRGSVTPEIVPLQAFVPMLLSSDFDFRHAYRFPEQAWLWHEYAAYVGPVFLCALAFALVRAARHPKVLIFLLAGCLFLAWVMGDFAPWSPWTLGHRLPVLSSLRASGRAMVPALFCLAVATGIALERSPVAFPALLLMAVNLASVTPHAFDDLFILPIPAAAPANQPFSQEAARDHDLILERKNYSRMAEDVRAGRGSLLCYEPTRAPVAASARGSRGEQWLEPAHGSAQMVAWSPNELSVETRATGRAALLINQNYHPDWERADGTPVAPVAGYLATAVDGGRTHVQLRFVSPLFNALASFSVLSLLGLLGWWRRESIRMSDKSSLASGNNE